MKDMNGNQIPSVASQARMVCPRIPPFWLSRSGPAAGGAELLFPGFPIPRCAVYVYLSHAVDCLRDLTVSVSVY